MRFAPCTTRRDGDSVSNNALVTSGGSAGLPSALTNCAGVGSVGSGGGGGGGGGAGIGVAVGGSGDGGASHSQTESTALLAETRTTKVTPS